MFDFDGVLVDTLGLCYEINKELNPHLGIDSYTTLYDGNVYETIQSAAKSGMNWVFHSKDEFDQKYYVRARELRIPAELKDVVRELSASFSLAIVSSTPSPAIAEILEKEGLRECFAEILGADVHTSKVIKIQSLLDSYHCAPEETVLITDTTGDIGEARAAGVASIAVSWGFHGKDKLQKADPYAVVDTVPELLGSIRGFFAESAIQ